MKVFIKFVPSVLQQSIKLMKKVFFENIVNYSNVIMLKISSQIAFCKFLIYFYNKFALFHLVPFWQHFKCSFFMSTEMVKKGKGYMKKYMTI